MSDHPFAPGSTVDGPPLGETGQRPTLPARRILPHSIEAERSILGGVLLSQKSFPEVVGCGVVASDFYHPAHKAIFEAMLALDVAGRPIDGITVAEQMRSSDTFGKLRAVNGDAYLVELMSDVVTVENIGFHARMVRGKATVRALIETAQEIAARGYGEYGDPEDFLAEAQSAILQVTAGSDNAAESLGEAADRVLRERIAIAEGKRDPLGLPSSLSKLTEIFGGYRPGRVYLIVGGSGSGKSALVMQELVSGAENYRAPGLIISCEMESDDLAIREMAAKSGVEARRIDLVRINGEREWRRLYDAHARVRGLPVKIDSKSQTLTAVVASIRRWHAERMREIEHAEAAARRENRPKPPRPVLRVAVDYAQLVNGELAGKRMENETQAQVRVSVSLTRLAKQLGIAILLAAQFKKTYDGTREPRRNDIDGSSQYAKDAWVILFIHFEQAEASNEVRATKLLVDKNRSGRTTRIDVEFHQAITRFLEPREPELPLAGSQDAWNEHTRGGDDH